MRHLKSGKKLNRNAAQRKALIKNLLTQFFDLGFVNTTLAKAKAVQPWIDKLINKAKKDNFNTIRTLSAHINSPEVSKKLIKEIAAGFPNRNSGYSRIIKLGNRRGDDAMMVKLELLELDQNNAQPSKKSKNKTNKTESKSKKTQTKTTKSK